MKIFYISLVLALFCHDYFQQNIILENLVDDNKITLLVKWKLYQWLWLALSSWFVLYEMLSGVGNPDPWEAVDIIDSEVTQGIS